MHAAACCHAHHVAMDGGDAYEIHVWSCQGKADGLGVVHAGVTVDPQLDCLAGDAVAGAHGPCWLYTGCLAGVRPGACVLQGTTDRCGLYVAPTA